jgi:hypothetical protein
MSDTYTPFDLGLDPSIEELITSDHGRAAVIRTSDRISFKRCRRKWGWSSHLRGNLTNKDAIGPLWYGTGMHYALEDFHGYNIYGSPIKAFEAYCYATWANRSKNPVPGMFHELKELGIGMMGYYELWLSERQPLKTLWIDGKPQVEVRALIPVPFNVKERYPDSPFDSVLYSVTIDRVCEDDDGLLWPLDYKSAKSVQTMHLPTDPQVGAYYWALGHIYPDRQVGGFIYQQHRKDVPEDPRVTMSGRLSVDKRQLTTHRAYRRVLKNIYGADHNKWPQENLKFLNELAASEEAEADKFIRRDKVYRNQFAAETEGTKILLEVEDMLNPNLPLYPNPVRDCVYTCSQFYHACIAMDDGSDWQQELDLLTKPKGQEDDKWRTFLPTLQDLSQPQLTVVPQW